MSIRQVAAWYLSLQAVGAAVWWALLCAWPASRAPFMARGAPDVTLLAFGLADAVLFIGTSAACAVGLWLRCRWVWPLLCVHTGAAGYAALYCWALVGLTDGDAWLGAVFMTPSLVVPGVLVWKLRPASGAC